jgi:hemerythrin
MNLDDAVISHIVWKDKLLEYLLKRDDTLDASELSRDERCPLGKWILRGAQEYASYPEYATLRAQHTRFHKAVGEVVRGAKLGLSIKPETVLGTDSEFGVASAAVVTAIVGLQRKMQHEVVVTVGIARETNGSKRARVQSKRANQLRETDEWDPSYSVGVAQLDEHHRHLISLINALLEAVGKQQERSTTGIVLGELAKYAENHFRVEEKHMAETDYPHLAGHKREHERFIARIAELKKEFDGDSGFDAGKVLVFLRSWLFRHIRQIDKKYSSHLQARGIH